MKIYAAMVWDEHEGLFNEHTPDKYFRYKEDAEQYVEEELARWIADGAIESNELWYEGSTNQEPDDVYMYVETIDVIE